MKNVLRLLIIAALAMAFALPAFAQDTQQPAGGAASAQDAQAKADLYKKFLDNYKGNPEQQRVAYEAGREYLSKYSGDTSAENQQIVKFIQNWVGKYENAVVMFNFNKAVAENPAQAFQLSRDILAHNPENLNVYLQLVAAGANSAKSGKSLYGDAANAARRALDLIAAGKTTDKWVIGSNQQEAVAGLNYYLGVFTLDSAPGDAAAALLKVAQSNSTFSKEPSTYQSLGLAYYNNEFKKLAQDYKDKCEGKEASPECDALFARVNQVLDRVIDAYARAVALSNGQPKYASINNAVKPALTLLYKQRHEGNDAGLNDLIAKVLSTPLPIPGQEPAPTPTPSSTTGTDGTTQPATGTPAKPAATPATTPATPPTNNQTKPSNPPQKPPVTRAIPSTRSRAAGTTSGR